MSIISIPNTFSVGAVIIAAAHNQNFSVIYNDYNGNVTDANIAPSAGIEYSKLSLSNSIQQSDILSTFNSSSGFGLVPSGGIIMWKGSIATIPTGWFLCNGLNSTPDLRDRFVICADADSSGTYNVGDTGDGSIPAHTHTVSQSAGTTVMANTGSSYSRQSGGGSNTTDVSLTINSFGTGTKNIAVFFALAYIMKS